MSPIAKSDVHHAPGLVGELVPGVGAMGDDVVIAGEDPVGEPVIADELQDFLLRIEFRRARRQRQQRHVGTIARNSRPSVCQPTDTPNSSRSHCARSRSRQRTTPSR
jgi:hypothetical protein